MNPTLKDDALAACDIVSMLYTLADSWTAQGRPREPDFVTDFYTIWGESQTYERRAGPRDRWHWLREWAPMATIRQVEKTLFVVFRGTVTNGEWSNNFRFQTRRFEVNGESFGEVHDGFGDSWESMRAEVFENVEHALEADVERIVIAGHSLGGAVATLAFTELVQQFDEFPFVGVVLGSPRVGSPGFAQAFHGLEQSINFRRIEILADPVPFLPPSGILGIWRFQHVGQVIQFSVDRGSDRANHLITSYRLAIETMDKPPIFDGHARP